jgi:hypothetical protein
MATLSREFPAENAMKTRRANATTEGVVERSIALLSAFTQAIIADPSLGAEIPQGATLVLIPDDDPELAAHNRLLGERAQAAGRAVHVRHVRTHELAIR